MVKNLPTIERSTRIRFGKNATEDQAENTIVFNASNVELQATNPGAVYLSPIRFREDFDDPEIVLLMYNKQTGEITESGSSASTAVEPPFQLVSGFGNTTTYTLEFNNPETAFVTESNVGIANSNPVHTLDVGSNLFVEDTGSNVLTVMGNTYIQNDVNIDGNLNVKGVFARIDTVNTSIKDAIVELGRGNISSDLGLIMDRPDSNVTVGFREGTDELIMAYTDSSAEGTTIVPLTSKDLSVRVYGNVEANYFTGDGSLLSNIASNLQEITDNGNTTSNTVQFTNPDVGLVATGNVQANYFIGDGSQLSNVATTLQAITDNGNTTSNTIQFTNPDVSLVATGNVEANYFIGDGSQLSNVATTLQAITDNGNTTSNVVQFTNPDVSLVATGNIQANYFIGDGSQLSNVATTLQAITDNGNTTSNTVQFTNADIGLVATGNIQANYFIGDGSQLEGLSSTLEDVVTNSNITSNTVQFTNTNVGIVATGNVHANYFIGNNLDINGTASVDSITVTNSDVGIVATGNVEAAYFIGDGSELSNITLQQVTDTSNTTSNTVQFTNTDVGIVATGNVEAAYFIGDGSELSNITLQQVTDTSNTTSNTVQFTNIDVGIVATGNVEANYFIGNSLDINGTASVDSITATNSDVGIIATGNVEANYFIGDGSQLTGLVTDLESVANNGNTTSNTIQFTNPTTAFTTDLTSNVGIKLDQLANVVITSPQTDHLLVYDGTDWVNEYNIHNFIKVHNTTSSTLYKGNVVYIVDSFNNNVANVALAKSDSASTMPAIGLIHEDVLPGQEGSAVAYGKVQGIDTSGFTEGQTVYVSNTSAGNIMNTKPYGLTDQIQNVGVCIRVDQNNGVVFVTGVGRSNDIPNAPIVTDPNYVYVNDQNNDLKKIEPSNLLTQLQTLQQVTDTSNTTSNTVQLTNADVGLVATGNVEANYFVGDGIYMPRSDMTISAIDIPSSASVEWATRIAGAYNDRGQDILTDSGGNTYTTGYYFSSLSLYNSDGTEFGTTLSGSGGDDVFIAKYNTSGAAQWVTRIAGTSNEDAVHMSLDSGGNVYVIGYYRSTSLIFYNADGTAFGTTLSNSGINDVFIAKYNTSGVVQWATRIAGTSSEFGNGISTDSGGNVYVTGSYSSTPLTLYNAGGTAFGTTLSNSGSNDTFIAKYNTSGVVQWATRIAGTFDELGYGMHIDSGGNVYVTGYYNSTTCTLYNVDGTAFGTTLPSPVYNSNCFLVKYNTSGVVQWVARIDGATGDDYGYGISADNDQNIYVTGYYSSSPLSLYNSDGTAFGTTLSNSGGSDTFIAKYASNSANYYTTIDSSNVLIIDTNTVQFTNTDVGIVATGNIHANYFIGDGSQLEGLAATLEDVVTNSNTTSNTVQFTNTDVGIVATGNVHANNFIGDVYASNVTITDGLIVNTGGVTKKFYSYEGTIPDQTLTTSSNVSLTFTSNIFYAKVIAHLVEDETEFSNMSLEVGGGSRTGGTTPNLKLGSVSVFGNASTNPWDSAVDVSTYAGSLEITPSATINNGDTPGTKPDALYNIFVEYISPDHVNGRLSSISLGGTNVKTFNY